MSLARCILSLPIPSTPIPDQTLRQGQSSSFDVTYSLLETELTILSTASELLEMHACNSELHQENLAFGHMDDGAHAELLPSLLNFIEYGELLPSWQPVIKQDILEGDSLEVSKTFSTIKASVARIAIAIFSSDKVMDDVFKRNGSTRRILDRCKRWLGGAPDLIITSSIILANLARRGRVNAAVETRMYV